MNTLGLNAGALDGSGQFRRVVSAAALGVVALSIASASGWRNAYGAAYGDAAVVVTLSGNQQVAGKATGKNSTSALSDSFVIRAGHGVGVTTSFGNGAVLRQTQSAASADGTAFGEAIVADVLGYSVSGALTSGAATPHVVHPGRVNQMCAAMGQVNAVANRMSPVYMLASATGFGEATLQLRGESFKRLDGFARSSATAIPLLRNDYTAIMATYGAFDFSRTEGAAKSNIWYRASASTWAGANSNSVGNRIAFAYAVSQGSAAGSGHGQRIAPGKALKTAAAQHLSSRAYVTYISKSVGTANSNGLATGNTVWSGRVNTTALAVTLPIAWAKHQWAFVNSATVAGVGNASGGVNYLAKAAKTAAAVSNSSAFVFANGRAIQSAVAYGMVIGFSNVDVLAPVSRLMRVEQERRAMQAPEENRTMLVEV